VITIHQRYRQTDGQLDRQLIMAIPRYATLRTVKSYYGRPIETHQRSFERYHPRPPMASPSSKLGVCNLVTPSYISGIGKATDFKFGGYNIIYMAIPNKRPLKILLKMERGSIQGLSNFFGYPLLSRERIKLRTSNLANTFTGPIRLKAHNNFGEKGAWAYP